MPHRPRPPCRIVSCPQLRPCPIHDTERPAVRAPDPRPSATARGYDGPWHRLRRAVLARQPWCARCGALATEVDHVVPRRAGGPDHPSNLQALCRRCHRRKTIEDQRGVGGQNL